MFYISTPKATVADTADSVFGAPNGHHDPRSQDRDFDNFAMLVQKVTVAFREMNRLGGTLMSRRSDFEQQQPKDRLGDAPVEAQYHAKMTAIMATVDEFLNDGAKGAERQTGIVILTFPYGDVSGRCNFMSNGADRKDIVVLFREMIARFEGQPELSGHG